jgi:hypothetical protein
MTSQKSLSTPLDSQKRGMEGTREGERGRETKTQKEGAKETERGRESGRERQGEINRIKIQIRYVSTQHPSVTNKKDYLHKNLNQGHTKYQTVTQTLSQALPHLVHSGIDVLSVFRRFHERNRLVAPVDWTGQLFGPQL